MADRYFVIEVPTDEDGPDPRVLADICSDGDLLAIARTVSLALDQGKRHSRCIIAREVVDAN